jgi:hypothetical protein
MCCHVFTFHLVMLFEHFFLMISLDVILTRWNRVPLSSSSLLVGSVADKRLHFIRSRVDSGLIFVRLSSQPVG